MHHGKSGVNKLLIKKFWKRRKVLIIGHTGFKGSWLIIFLNFLGSHVYGYSLKPEKHHIIFNKLKLKNFLKLNCYADINDTKKLKRFIKITKPDIVINLSAQSLVRRSYSFPIETYKTNFFGAVNLLNIVRNFKNIKAVLMITTDKVYFNKEKNYLYNENDKLGGHDPYSASKAASEIAIESFQKSFFNKRNKPYIATARAGNIIGGGDWSEDRLIPDLFKSYLKKKTLVIRSPNAIRPWQHVLEVIYGYTLLIQMLCAKKSNFIGAWNFGPNKNNFIKVKSLVKKVLDSGLKVKIKVKVKNNDYHESKILKLNNQKAVKFLNWKPVFSIKETINLTCEWYNSMYNNHGRNLYSLSIKQINFFFNKFNK